MQIQSNDGLPQQICTYCLAKCMDWHKFKNSCHLVHQRLEKQLRIFLSDSEEEDIGTQDPKISNLDVVEIYPSLINLEVATAQEDGIYQQGSGFTNEDQISPGKSYSPRRWNISAGK